MKIFALQGYSTVQNAQVLSLLNMPETLAILAISIKTFLERLDVDRLEN